MKILVSGALAFDKIMNFPDRFADHILPDKIHVLSVCFAVDKFEVNFGGTAGNIAYNLALLGEKPVILAGAGNDFSRYKKWLLKHKIDLSGVKIVKNYPTASAHIITDRDDNQITAYHPGADGVSISNKDKNFNNAEIAIISPGQIDDMIKRAKKFKKNNISYIFDPGQQIPIFTKNQMLTCLTGAKVFISNDYEFSTTLKKSGLTKDKLKKKIEILVTTLGEKGSVIEVKNRIYKIPPAKPKNTSDPTGAGDAYRAGFIKGMVSNMPFEKIGRLAGLVSVYTVEKYGTQTHKFTYKELQRRYKQNFKEAL